MTRSSAAGNTLTDPLPWQVQGHAEVRELLTGLSTASLLFTGPHGVGRRQVARWYTALLNCAAPAGGPCGTCSSCRLWTTGGHPDYREVSPQLVTAQGRLNRRPEIRIGQLVAREGGEDSEPLTTWLERRPLQRVRVGVIDGADRLTTAAANSFLKMLEEPPSYVRIILIAPAVRAVLPTLASRCTTVRFGAAPTAGLEPANHPAHHLGTLGPLLQAGREPEAFREAESLVEGFLSALHGTLEESLSAAAPLEAAWLGKPEWDYGQLLREQLRLELDVSRYAQAVDAVTASEEQLAAYVAPGVVLQLLALQLRRVTRD